MLLLEHDAKELLARRNVPLPEGMLVAADRVEVPPFAPPWIVKAQVPTGGRGKAGGILRADDASSLHTAARKIAATLIKGHEVREMRIEAAVPAGAETYLGIMIDPLRAGVMVMVSAAGGVDVEEQADGAMHTAFAEASPTRIAQAIFSLSEKLPAALRPAITQAGERLAAAFIELEATLVEINPLFVLDDGAWFAADVRLVVDENAVPRQTELAALLDARPQAYPDAAFKRRNGYDLVVVDPEGEIGLVTTGAGLSMKLIDQMTVAGARPFNFCDIRSGQMRGDPARLISALERVASGPNVKVVLLNIFAGITDLAEFAQLLLDALDALPGFDFPLVVRLAGNGEDRADALLRASGRSLHIERDLDRAVALATEIARGAHV